MKHSVKITILLLAMFFIAQLIGIFVAGQYAPEARQVIDAQGEEVNVTSYNLPYGMDPPENIKPRGTFDLIFSFVIAFSIVVFIMLILMKYKAELLLRFWFFFVVILAIGIALNSFILKVPNSSLIALVVAIPLAFYKIFKRNLLVHNITELLVYPGIAVIFATMILSWTTKPILAVVVLLVLISLYDMYAVWHSGFMQKMAQYQIQQLKIFTGFFIPYLGRKQRQVLAKAAKSKSKKLKNKKIKVSLAILGGGDVVFPLILAGVVLRQFGLFQSILVAIGATLALAGLFYISEKGKFYPAMPFIAAGCFVALGVIYLI